MYRYGHPGESGTGEAPALREPKRCTKAKTPEDFCKARSGCRRRNSPRAVVVCLSQDEKGEEKQGKKQSNAQKTLPKALFFCHTPLLLSAFLLPAFGSRRPFHTQIIALKDFLSRDAPFANENKMETKCKKAFGKGRSKRERAGIKSGERHFTRKIQTAFCPRRRLFPRPPFC